MYTHVIYTFNLYYIYIYTYIIIDRFLFPPSDSPPFSQASRTGTRIVPRFHAAVAVSRLHLYASRPVVRHTRAYFCDFAMQG